LEKKGQKNPAGIFQDKLENSGIFFIGLIPGFFIPGFFRNQNPGIS